ncbi:MAG TPA: NAD-dependent epimerase/dehydratase family protein [Bacteroidales bacterium]|nr:NAD-dependent epimerase/dehydratase family protein [Bacteroidales bacterium]
MMSQIKNGPMGEFVSIVPQIGILEWFYRNDYNRVEKTVNQLKILGIKELRTGVSWADYLTPEGEKWYAWLIPHLAENFSLLPCFFYTPPSLGIVPDVASPPNDPTEFASFIDVFINKFGSYFEYVELWNEPNNREKYDYTLDESYEIFSQMVRLAANGVRKKGKKTVLGGISPIDPGFIRRMGEKKALAHIDVVGIHGFPDVFDSHWRSWEESIESIQNALNQYDSKAEIWITETGYSTWRYDERKQVEKFIRVLTTPVKRVYWYALNDVPYHLPATGGHHTDEREYHFGMINEDGSPKLLYRLWEPGGIMNVIKNQWMTYMSTKTYRSSNDPVLITGGAGFIGTNLANRLIKLGHPVYIFDSLSRTGVENNLKWLRQQHKNKLNIIIADVRDRLAVEDAIKNVSHVFHLAAQVAVTTSLVNPAYDYSVNVRGTVNVLEAIRNSSHKPSLIFTSTNKVYGNMDDIQIVKNTTRYLPGDNKINRSGINEMRRLDFHSPYGSSKGAADQYVLDYARSFGLKSVVFRMSCIYGEHQFGTEDQGWVAHFILKALRNEKIILYGDGMQVRDVLFADDLVEAFLLAWKDIDKFQGEAFNMGGGPENSISLLELLDMLENLLGRQIPRSFDEWRKGDQKYYVTDTTKFRNATGWKPLIPVKEGIRILYDWLSTFYNINAVQKPVKEFQE